MLPEKNATQQELTKRTRRSLLMMGGGILAAAGPSPSHQVMQLEQGEAVRRVLERLPEDYRRVLTLRYQEGRTFEEIGRLLERTPNAARKLLLRALERVQQELKCIP